jgi:hypothetical protein
MVQECPRALTSLKYFAENAPEYYVITAGSLLGLAMHGGTAYREESWLTNIPLYAISRLKDEMKKRA